MVSPDATYPAFAFSLWDRPDGTGTFAYKVLGKRESGTPLVLIHEIGRASCRERVS